MLMSIIEKILDTQEFATLPTVAAKVLEVLKDDTVNIKELANIIQNDIALTVKLLRMSNSPLYGTRVEITSVQQAIITLGLSRLTNMVLGISIFSKFMAKSNKTITPYLERFWWQVASNRKVAKSIAVKTN